MDGDRTFHSEHAMSEAGLHPLESILRLCAAAAPDPWYPRLFAQQEDVDRKALGQCLEMLWLSGLIDRGDGGPEKGPAIALTREGQRVLLDPQALERLRAGQPVSVNDRAAVVRQALTGRMRPLVTVVVILINVLVFTWGYSVARAEKLDNVFLRGTAIVKEPPTQEEYQRQQAVYRIQEASGSISASNLINGQWWRLLTAGFVHIGFLHLLMNMVVLYLSGRFIEQMWGHVRYLLIYLTAVLGGDCLAVSHNIAGVAGASGAICGLLAAEAVWFLFNRRYLPRGLVRQARTNFFVNLVLLIFISSFKDVSGWGHFGGAAAGAMAAMLLHLHRFGPPLWRWLAFTGFVPMLWYGQFALQHARATDPRWQQLEQSVLREHFRVPVTKALRKTYAIYNDHALPLLEQSPDHREPSRVEDVLKVLAQQRDQLQALDDSLFDFGPLYSSDALAMLQQYHHIIAERLQLVAAAEEALQNGEDWPPK